MERNVLRSWWMCVLAAGVALTACDGSSPSGGGATGAPNGPASGTSNEPAGAQPAPNNGVQGWRESWRAALERLDTSTAEGRREVHAALRREWEEHQAQLDTLAHEMRAATREQREAALAKARELTDQLERHLDDLEDAGSEQWGAAKAGAVEHAERLRLELERLLADKSSAAQGQR